jgi:hypothetical protein
MPRGVRVFAICLLSAILLLTSAPVLRAQTHVIPSLSVSERYDSNVYFVTEGQKLADYVTTFSPALSIEHKGRQLDVIGGLRLIAETYVRNPGLNYIAGTGSVAATLDELVGRFDRRLKLTVSDYVTYTPQPPAFYAPLPGGQTILRADAPDNFIRGIQASRANSLINVATVNTNYGLTQSISLTGTLSHQYMRFGTSFAPTPGQGFFTTSFLNIGAGPRFNVTPVDTLTFMANYSRMSFSQGTSFSSSFNTTGATASWNHAFSKRFSTTLTAGATVFSPGGNFTYLGGLTFLWHEQNTDLTLTYSRSVFPSFFIAAVPLISDVVSIGILHRFTDKLSGSLTGNYGTNKSIDGPEISFVSYGAVGSLNYAVTKRMRATLAYMRTQTKNVFVGQNFSFDRDTVTLSVAYEWR